MVDSTTPSATPPTDPAAILRSRSFIAVLVLAAVVGIVVSLVGWGFLELVHWLQVWVFTDLPHGLGLDPVPSWWALPICALAGFPVAFAIPRLPGNGGHVPAKGLAVGGTEPNMVPGVAIAALGSLGLGLVVGPEAPLIAIGTGVAVYTVKLAKRDAPTTLLLVLGSAGAFAAISTLFGSPIIAAIIIIEASGLGGATLPPEAGRLVDESFVPLLDQVPGFVAYYWIDAGDGVMASVSVFDDQAGADKSVAMAHDWVRDNAATLIPNPPQVTEGHVVASDTKQQMNERNRA